MPGKNLNGLTPEQSDFIGGMRKKKKASVEDTIPLQVKTQKELILAALTQHRSTIDGLITNIEEAQTIEELLPMVESAAKNLMSTW